MKKFNLLLFIIIASFSLNSQVQKTKIINEKGKIISTEKIKLADKNGETNTFYTENPSKKQKKTHLTDFSKGQNNFDPGVLPEGEYIQDVAYSTDGTKVFVVNRHSYNVTVFDASTMDTIYNIPVGYGAVAIDLNDNQAVVACLFDEVATIIDLSDYSTQTVATSDRPGQVKINPEGTHAYVGCETRICDVINLSTNTIDESISDFPVYTERISWSTGSGRTYTCYNDYVFTKNGDYLVVADNTNDELDFYNTSTNNIETSLAINSCRHIGISADSTTVYTTSYDDDLAYRIDAATQSVVGNPIAIPDGPRGGTNIVSNSDGTKIYLGTGGNHGTLIDFVDEEAITYPSIYSAFWCDVTYDNQYAVHGNYNFAIVNFDTETIEDVNSGYSQSVGAASPNSYNAISMDPLRFEGVYSYDYSSVSNINFEGTYIPADNYEGDAPVRLKVSDDGSKVLLANHMSQSVSVFNLTTNTVDTIYTFPADADIESVSITHDSQYGLITFDDLGVTKIIDLNTLEIVASVTGGGHTIRISDDNEYAYISNIAGSDKINIIHLDGASSSNVGNIITGQMGATYAHYGILSDIRIDPTGNYIAIAVSFDDQVKIVDLSTNTIVQTLTTGFDFPLQLCFNDAGDKLAVSNYYGNTVSIIDFNGASSSVQGTYSCGGEYPARMAFNSLTNEFYVCNNNTDNVVKIDPDDGSIAGTINLGGSPINVDFDNDGNHIILFSGDPHEIVNESGESYTIPYTPANFDNNPNDLTAVVSPGLDNLSIINWASSEGPHLEYTIPVNGATDVAYNSEVSATFDVELTEEDLSGVTITPDPGNINAAVSGYTVTISHDDFDSNTEYTATIPEGAVSDGTSLLIYDVVWSFTTIEETYSVTFSVTDGTNPIENANVQVPDLSVDDYTDANGELIIQDVAAGSYDYTVSATDYVPFSDNFEVIDENIIVDVVLEPENIENINSDIVIYPNPNNGKFLIKLKNKNLKDSKISIFDLNGKIIYKDYLYKSTTKINFSDKEAGIYIIKIENNNKIIYNKLLIK